MKRLLLSTSLLVASAGLAHAQAVTITGEGRMGVVYETISLGGASFSGTIQENRLVLNFTVAVSGDNGLSFGGSSRVQINNGGSIPVVTGFTVDPVTGALVPAVRVVSGFAGSQIYVEANGLRLSFGNLDGAIINSGVASGYPGCGIGYVGGHYCGDSAGLVGLFYIGLNNPAPLPPNAVWQAAQAQEQDYTGGGAPARARLDYSFGTTSISLSHDRGGATELGVRSTFDAFTVALGYSNRVAVTIATPAGFEGALVGGSVVTLSGRYDGGTWGVGILAARLSYDGAFNAFNHTNWAVSGNVELGGGNLYAYVGRVFHAGVGGRVPFSTAGISYGYGLGGGATLTVGVERLSTNALLGGVSFTSASLGVAFTF